jgi:hypothetical protein
VHQSLAGQTFSSHFDIAMILHWLVQLCNAPFSCGSRAIGIINEKISQQEPLSSSYCANKTAKQWSDSPGSVQVRMGSNRFHKILLHPEPRTELSVPDWNQDRTGLEPQGSVQRFAVRTTVRNRTSATLIADIVGNIHQPAGFLITRKASEI